MKVIFNFHGVGKRLKELQLKQKQILKRTLGIANARQFWYKHAEKHLTSSLQSIFVILRWRTVGTPHRGTFVRLHWSSVEEEARASYCWNLDPPHRLSPEHHRLISVLHFNISIPSIPQLNGPSRSPQSTYLRILFVFADKFWSTSLLPNTQQIQELPSSNSINSWNENTVYKKG